MSMFEAYLDNTGLEEINDDKSKPTRSITATPIVPKINSNCKNSNTTKTAAAATAAAQRQSASGAERMLSAALLQTQQQPKVCAPTYI
jgi:hypothetical protein